MKIFSIFQQNQIFDKFLKRMHFFPFKNIHIYWAKCFFENFFKWLAAKRAHMRFVYNSAVTAVQSVLVEECSRALTLSYSLCILVSVALCGWRKATLICIGYGLYTWVLVNLCTYLYVSVLCYRHNIEYCAMRLCAWKCRIRYRSYVMSLTAYYVVMHVCVGLRLCTFSRHLSFHFQCTPSENDRIQYRLGDFALHK